MYSRTQFSFGAKPPVARITPRRARMVWRLSPISTTAPSTRPLLFTSSTSRASNSDRHVAPAQAVVEPPDQRIAHDQPRAACEAQAVGRVAQQQLRGRRERAERGERLQQDRDVVFPDHHAAEHHERRDRRPHAREVLAEQPPVERQRCERAAGERAAGLVGVIVRDGAAARGISPPSALRDSRAPPVPPRGRPRACSSARGPISASRKRRASSMESGTPSRLAWLDPGIHTVPAEVDVVPPT